MSELILKKEVYAIIGAAIEVHRELGAGFLEAVCQEALEIELQIRGVSFEPQKRLTLFYKGQRLEKLYIADFICYNQIIVELKALMALWDRRSSTSQLPQGHRYAHWLTYQFWLIGKTRMETLHSLIIYTATISAQPSCSSCFSWINSFAAARLLLNFRVLRVLRGSTPL